MTSDELRHKHAQEYLEAVSRVEVWVNQAGISGICGIVQVTVPALQSNAGPQAFRGQFDYEAARSLPIEARRVLYAIS